MDEIWIPRDMLSVLQQETGIFVHIILGPRQCGKSTLLQYIGQGVYDEVTLDDLLMRRLAETGPAFFLTQYTLPVIIDEIQYAPNLFPAIKQYVDQLKQKRLHQKGQPAPRVLFYLTGSNQILFDKHVKETLVGRARYFYLKTLSVHEICAARPTCSVQTILFQGGWPELYHDSPVRVVPYLNDYIQQYIEKEIILSVGITKQREFAIVLGMLAARTEQLLNMQSIAKDSGVSVNTVKEWIAVLERTRLLSLLQPFESKLSKRLTKSPKLYFLDTGLAVRLQGWTEATPMIQSALAGGLFETLVFAEIIKYIHNFQKDWRVFLWRTKDQEEIDFLVQIGRERWLAIDAKLGMGSVQAASVPAALSTLFPSIKTLIVVTLGGEKRYLSETCLQVPITALVSVFESLE
ncbi:MAG: ATP-binding protein [Legionellaceae bacterium]|nr:ATP-binding protein [Legionellaceae bacterium]